VDLSNTRFQTEESAGLTAAQVPRLKLKWAFGLGADASPRSQPAIFNGTVYVGAAKLYGLEAQSGCTEWVFAGDAPVRSGLAVGPGPAIYFGDYKANIYAVSGATGKLLWKTHADENFAAMITGTPVIYKGTLYAGVASFEEVMAGSPKYPCCSFRGSVVALDAATGKQIWKTYTIASAAQPIPGTNFNGPSGAGIWSSPTVDEKLGRLYVATGDNYSTPATGTSDAVIALDLKTGAIAWTRQATAGDIYNVGCDPGVNGACPEAHGHDFDFGQPPILVELATGKRALVIGQKSGLVYGFDPDADGKPMWNTRIGEGGTLGGIQWGSAASHGRVYSAVSDLRLRGVADPKEKLGYRLEADGAKGGGLFALDAATGTVAWSAKAAPCGERKLCSPAQSGAVSGMPGVVFSGSLDGHVRAYAADTGAVIWDGDTERDYATVNGEAAHGGSLDVAGPVIAGGAVYVVSGYGTYGGMPGNVLLVYSAGGE
jgi:polyvinyl alcohol dehydrogenase (cytochrome)